MEITVSGCQGTKEVLLLLPDDAAAVDPRLGLGTWRVRGLGNYTCTCKTYNPHYNPSYPDLLTYLIGSPDPSSRLHGLVLLRFVPQTIVASEWLEVGLTVCKGAQLFFTSGIYYG